MTAAWSRCTSTHSQSSTAASAVRRTSWGKCSVERDALLRIPGREARVAPGPPLLGSTVGERFGVYVLTGGFEDPIVAAAFNASSIAPSRSNSRRWATVYAHALAKQSACSSSDTLSALVADRLCGC